MSSGLLLAIAQTTKTNAECETTMLPTTRYTKPNLKHAQTAIFDSRLHPSEAPQSAAHSKTLKSPAHAMRCAFYTSDPTRLEFF
jgi:hypothetical protein